MLVVPCKTSRRLVELGLMEAEENGSFARRTPAGLRAVADAIERGRLEPIKPLAANQEPED